MNDASASAPLISSMRPNQNQVVGVSIIIPAHNAGATIEATLKSVLQQSYPGWEAIVVDDGSNDGLGTIAQKWVDRDRRFRLLRQERAGVSAARNRGLRDTLYPFVLFLDADDQIASDHLQLMVSALMADSTLDAVHCGWQRIYACGAVGSPHFGSDDANLFRHFAFHCHFAIHACLMRREIALAAGGFDHSLTTCEDWDFYQRVARTGARFGRVPEVLAFYYMRADSASRDNRRCLIDACTVIERAHQQAGLEGSAGAALKEDLLPDDRNLAVYNMIVYCAAQEIGAGRDGQNLLDIGNLSVAVDLSPILVAENLFESLPIGANRSETDWLTLWTRVEVPVTLFLRKLEAQVRAPSLAFVALRHLEKRILLNNSDEGTLVLGNTCRKDIELTKPIRDQILAPQLDRLICRLTLKGKPVGAVELPAPGVVIGSKIAGAAAEGRRRLLLSKALTPLRLLVLGLQTFFGLLRRPTLRLLYHFLLGESQDRRRAAKGLRQEVSNLVKTHLPRVLAARAGRAARKADQQWQDRLNAAALAGRALAREQINVSVDPERWEQIFALPDPWAYNSDYEVVKRAQTLSLLPDKPFVEALEIGCAEGHFTICLAPKVQRLRSIDISSRALKRAEERCAALHNVTFQRLDLDLEVIPGTFDLIVCSEVLYYLRGWRDIVARLLRQLRPGGFFLTTHSRLLVDDPESTGFAWHESFTFGVENIAKIIAAQPAVALRRELRTPLYRVLLYERFSSAQTLDPPEVVKSNQMGQMTPLAEEFARWPRRPLVKFGSQKASAVPILMYHRIAAEGPPGLERYRVAPDLFAAQMAILHRAGYRAIELEDWIKALLRDEPLFGRPMVLTFDDGYRDFLTAATPVLRLFGFPATVFLVAGRMGGMSDWDASYGDPAPLLSWEEVHALRDVGIGFGCHSLVHQLMTGMPLRELAESTSRARGILEEGLASLVTTLAYPHGAENEFVRRVIGDLGFQAAVTCEEGISRLGDDPLRLRRVEVTGACTPEQLLRLIDPGLASK